MCRFLVSDNVPICGDSTVNGLPVDIEDKKVLLVGGRSSMVPHY